MAAVTVVNKKHALIPLTLVVIKTVEKVLTTTSYIEVIYVRKNNSFLSVPCFCFLFLHRLLFYLI